MTQLRVHLFTMVLSAFHTDALRTCLYSDLVVTSGANLEDLYTRVKEEIPYTYLDDGEGGQLRREDYIGSISYEDYPKARNKNKKRPDAREFTDDLDGKSDICGYIFNSTFYDMREEEAVSFNSTETKQYLKQNYENVYNEIYTTESVDHTEWPNPYMPRDFRVGRKEYQESTFRCLARKRTAEVGTYTEYFVSPIYQMSSPECSVNGRFVFGIDEHKNLKISALAENIGVTDGYVIRGTHSAYYNARKNEHPEPDEASSPLCTMSVPDKIRLCATVLATIGFPDPIKFWPSEEYIEPECEKRKVIAHGKLDVLSKFFNIYSEADVKMTYDELMIGCKAIPIPKNGAQQRNISPRTEDTKSPTIFVPGTTDAGKLKPATETYYLGPGLDSQTVIVFKRSAEMIFTPLVGIRDLYLMVAGATLKTVTILEYRKT